MTWAVGRLLRLAWGQGQRRGRIDRPWGWLTSGFCLAVVLLLPLLLQPDRVAAHTSAPPAPPQSATAPASADAAGAIEVNEHLGARIPLDLSFRDEGGRTVVLGELITAPTIILPVYYSCTNVCNFLQAGLAAVLPALKPEAAREYKVLSLSFDEAETPEQATRAKRIYLTGMDRPFPEEGWRFLTGDRTAIRRFTEAAGFRFAKKGRDFIHPVATLVVAQDGTIVRYLYGTTFLAKDLTLALLEAAEGRVGATIRTMVSYCFSFDPEAKTYVFNLLRVSATMVILCTVGFLLFLLLAGKKERPRPVPKA